MRAFLAVAAAAVVVLAFRAAPASQAPVPAWGPAPPVFPAGARMAVMQGDPSQTALFTVRLEMPDGYTIASHFHPTDEHITVISGTFLVGMGDAVDTPHAITLAPGGFITAGATMHHWAVAKGKTVVQVHAMGPFSLTYVNPKDDPQNKARTR